MLKPGLESFVIPPIVHNGGWFLFYLTQKERKCTTKIYDFCIKNYSLNVKVCIYIIADSELWLYLESTNKYEPVL